MKIRITLMASAALLVAGTIGCSAPSAPDANSGVGVVAAMAAQDTTGDQDAASTGPTAALVDPCTALTTADIQPFLTAEIVTALPTIFVSDSDKACEWATNDKASSLIVDYLVGDDAQTKVLLNSQPGSDAVAVPGVGDVANHGPGDPSMLFSYKGTGSSTAVCTVTTTGRQFALVADPTAPLTDAQATTIDEQYGTLCNRLYGSGNTTPTVPSGAVEAAPTMPSLTGTVPADSGQTLPGTDIPLPAGVDCSGAHTQQDSLLGLNCDQPIDDPLAVYTFYLTALPAHGFTVNSESFVPARDGAAAHASILFTDDANGLGAVSIINGRLSVSKQEN